LPLMAQSTPPSPLSGEWKKIQASEHFWAEGACAGDVNKDGKMDVLCGPYWYQGPDYTQKHQIYPATQAFDKKKDDGSTEKIPGFKGFLSGENDYSKNFLSYSFDINADGWIDYIVIGFPGEQTFWYENPKGKDGDWVQHTILDVTDNESPILVDLTGDGKPELLCINKGFLGYAEADWSKPGEPWKFNAISPNNNYQRFTHGIGYGDVNGDGLVDILESSGWWERPAKWDGKSVWTKHEAQFGKGGAQMYAYDVNGDKKADIITSLEAHGYGLVWFEQTNDGGVQGWNKHVVVGGKIDGQDVPGETGLVWSQMHAIDLVDMNGDGLKDIITGKRFWAHGPNGDAESGAPAVLYWLELKRTAGKASYTAHIIDDNSGVGTQVMAVDMNGDKKPDVVVGNKKGCFVHLQK
jgi:hypothetical protein